MTPMDELFIYELGFQVLERGVGLSTHSDSELITQALCLNPPEGEVSFLSKWKNNI